MIRKIIVALFALVISAGAAAAQSCNNYPNTLTNGQPADANQVMANFNYVANCVNTLTTANSGALTTALTRRKGQAGTLRDRQSVARSVLRMGYHFASGSKPSMTVARSDSQSRTNRRARRFFR